MKPFYITPSIEIHTYRSHKTVVIESDYKIPDTLSVYIGFLWFNKRFLIPFRK